MLSIFCVFLFLLPNYLSNDYDLYPDLFAGGKRRNEIDSNSFYVNNRPLIGGFTTQWKDEFITIIFVGNPLHFYELQVDLYVSGMWIYDESCRISNKCGDVAGKILFDRKTSSTLQDLNQPMVFGQTVIGDYVMDNISISFYMSYTQKFGLATSVPIKLPQSGVFGIGLEAKTDMQDSPVRNMLSHAIQRSITIMADRSNETRVMGARTSGSMTIGRQDLVNCKNDFQPVSLENTNSWMIRLTKVVIDNYIDNSNSLVAFRPGQMYTLAPKSFTDIFYYKIGAKLSRDGKLWTLDLGSGFKSVKVRFFFLNAYLDFDLMDFVIMPNSSQSTAIAFLTIQPNPDVDDPIRPAWIFGNDLLRKYCLELFLDTSLPRISFATNIWTPEKQQNGKNSRLNIYWNVFMLMLFVHGIMNNKRLN